MKRLAFPLSIVALALAACAETPVLPAMSSVASSAPIATQTTQPYTTGYGRIEQVLLGEGPISAARGGTATGASGHPAGTSATDRPEPPVGQPSNASGRMVRYGVRMTDGTLQWIDTDTSEFKKGDQVLLTSDHKIQKAP